MWQDRILVGRESRSLSGRRVVEGMVAAVVVDGLDLALLVQEDSFS